MNVQVAIPLRSMCTRCVRKIRFSNFSYKNRLPFYNYIKQFNVIPQGFYCKTGTNINLYSTSAEPHSEELVDANVFEKVCEETLESLTEFFEDLIENKDALKNADVSYSSGVLTLNLGELGTYVINRQSPNRQIWLSSPVSGPKRYDFVADKKYWVYKHDMVPLHKLLQNEISNLLGDYVDFSKCLYSKL